MPIINKVPNKKISINLQGAIGIPNTDANILLIGHRSGSTIAPAPNYPMLQPKYGYPLLTAYRNYDLPSFSSGDDAISYMQALGFTANYGLSNSLVFPAPNQVITPVGVSPYSLILQWNTPPTGFELLANGTQLNITQVNGALTATATVQMISIDPCQLMLVNVQKTFTVGEQISIKYIDTSINVPDPTRTDEICMMVYSAVNSINTNFPQTINTITPGISISFLNPFDLGFSPNSNARPYLNNGGTNILVSSVQILPNGHTAIYYAATPANFGITPLVALGKTMVSKDETTGGTLVQVLPGLTSSGVGIELKDVKGVFAIGDKLSIVLDSTQDVFSLLNTPKQYPVSPYELRYQSEITSPTSIFAPLFNYLAKANAPTSVNNGSFFAMGVVANIYTPKQQANTLPVFDPSTFGAEYITGAYYPYSHKFGDYPLNTAMVASCYAGIIACNDVPFNPLNNVLLKLPVSTDLTTVLNDLSSINVAINLGWTPIGVNSKLQAYIVRAVTGLLFMPGGGVPDTEYFPVTDWQIIGLWKKVVFQALSQPQFTNKRKSNQLKDSIVNALQPLALNFQTQGMFYNMSKLVSEFQTIDDSQDPSKYNVITPVCLTPEFNAIDVTVNVVSYLSQITTTA